MNLTFDQNYHTHTYRCKHATGDVADYCQAAIEKGVSILGISDHTPWPDSRWPTVRMEMDELPSYCQALDEAKRQFSQIQLLKGMECEYVEEFHAFLEDYLLGELAFDYLVGGNHYFWQKGEWISCYKASFSVAGLRAYVDCVVQSIASGMFSFIAHPDLFGVFYLKWDSNTIAASKDILAAASEYQVPLEVNSSGFRKPKIETPEETRHMYPWLPFWEMASDYDIHVIVNSDAHRPEDLNGKTEEAFDIVKSFNLKVTDLRELGHLQLKKAS